MIAHKNTKFHGKRCGDQKFMRMNVGGFVFKNWPVIMKLQKNEKFMNKKLLCHWDKPVDLKFHE